MYFIMLIIWSMGNKRTIVMLFDRSYKRIDRNKSGTGIPSKATRRVSELFYRKSELRSCVKVEVNVLYLRPEKSLRFLWT